MQVAITTQDSPGDAADPRSSSIHWRTSLAGAHGQLSRVECQVVRMFVLSLGKVERDLLEFEMQNGGGKPDTTNVGRERGQIELHCLPQNHWGRDMRHRNVAGEHTLST